MGITAMADYVPAPKHAAAFPPARHFAPAPPITTLHAPFVQREANCACGGGCPSCQIHPLAQPKLEVSTPGDHFEQEADRVADHVMESQTTSALQRKPDDAGDGARAHAGEERGLFRRESGPAPSSVPESHVEGLGAGQPLDAATRDFMEPRFGRDFGHVRVHTDERAAESAQSVGAQAYTVGRDIVFGAGQYAPGAAEGRRLLAHELTHTVQQSGGRGPSVQRKLQVGSGLKLDTKGFTTSKTGDVYTCPSVVKNSVWNELFTSLLHSPRVFQLAGTTSAEMDASLAQHMKARLGILDFASKKKYSFGAGSAFKMNPDFWVKDATGWHEKPGVTRKEAIKDLNVHPKEYSIACLAATKFTMEGGSGSAVLALDSGAAQDDWIPGDWGYIKNTKFPTDGTGTPGLEGENLIYAGKDKFWGHFGPGNEYKTLKQWFDQVEGWHGGALIKDTRRHPSTGLK